MKKLKTYLILAITALTITALLASGTAYRCRCSIAPEQVYLNAEYTKLGWVHSSHEYYYLLYIPKEPSDGPLRIYL